MTESSVPTLHCDGADPNLGCDEWDLDHYAMDASAVGGVRITLQNRAPGWTRTEKGDDLCPSCTALVTAANQEGKR
jgi:hypothetical protein